METGYDPDTEADNLIRASRQVFLISLGAGTVLLLAFLIIGKQNLVLPTIGFCYVIFAVMANIVMVLNNLLFVILQGKKRMKLFFHTLLLLLNIPIALVYMNIVFTTR